MYSYFTKVQTSDHLFICIFFSNGHGNTFFASSAIYGVDSGLSMKLHLPNKFTLLSKNLRIGRKWSDKWFFTHKCFWNFDKFEIRNLIIRIWSTFVFNLFSNEQPKVCFLHQKLCHSMISCHQCKWCYVCQRQVLRSVVYTLRFTPGKR